MKRTAQQADLDAPPAAAAAAAGAGDPGAAPAPELPAVVASAIEQLETLWAGLPVRHKNKFRDYAYMLFVGHEAEHGETDRQTDRQTGRQAGRSQPASQSASQPASQSVS